jgi:protein O-GlcNAc transferase
LVVSLDQSRMTTTTTHEIPGGVQVVTPDTLNLVTPYVLYEQRDWFEDEIAFLRRLLQPGQRAIDIGASYGVYTLSIAKAVGPAGAVWAFEPTSSTAAFLAQSIAANHFTQVVLERSALSGECGTAELTIHNSPEFNTLARGEQSGNASETVPVVTLDDCLERYGWENIDLVKIDAEGEEANIIDGGRRFFANSSPLILYEIKATEALHLDLVSKFAALGFDSYRLVPGLDVLVPFDSAGTHDRYLLNLFCCKSDRAAALSDRGLLLTAASLAAYRAENRFNDFAEAHLHEYSWQDKLAALPYGTVFAHMWESSSDTSAANSAALACFAVSQDESLDQLERFSALETGLRTLVQLCNGQPASLRFSSVARIAREYGARFIAVDALSTLFEELSKESWVDPNEPFLAPGKRFDAIAPSADLQDWILAAVLEELERVGAFTSFNSGDRSRARLEMIAALGYGSEEMARRLLLVRTRFPNT